MKTRILLLFIFLWITAAHSQSVQQSDTNDLKTFQAKITTIENNIKQLQLDEERLLKLESSLKNNQYSLQNKTKELSDQLNKKELKLQSQLDSLQQTLDTKSTYLEGTTNNLDSRLVNNEEVNQQNFTQISSTLDLRKWAMLIVIVVLCLLIIIVFLRLRKQINYQKVKVDEAMLLHKSQLENQIAELTQKTDRNIQQMLNKMDTQLKKELKTVDQKLSETKDQINSKIKTQKASIEELLKDEVKKTTENLSNNRQYFEKEISELKKEYGTDFAKIQSALDKLNKDLESK